MNSKDKNTTTRPIVSVIMAAYNCEQYIHEAIQSILNQTLQAFELIIVNDCSTDNTAKIISSYSDSRIIAINNSNNQGAAYSRNIAIKKAQGSYIAILDADDIALPERLKTQLLFLEKNNAYDGVGSFVQEIDASGKNIRFVKVPITHEEIKCSTTFRCSIIHSTAFIKKEFFINNNLFYKEDFLASQDFEMWSRALFVGKFYNIPQYLVKYRISLNQISTKNKKEQIRLATTVYQHILSKLLLGNTSEEINTHLAFIGFYNKKEQPSLPTITDWLVLLYNQNLIYSIFDKKIFAHEILLRQLKYLKDNNFSLAGIFFKQLQLHLLLKKIYFPYYKLTKRIAKKIKQEQQ